MVGVWLSLITSGDVCSDTLKNSKDWTLADKVLKKTHWDSQKRFLIYPANSKYLAADYCDLAILLDHDKDGNNAG